MSHSELGPQSQNLPPLTMWWLPASIVPALRPWSYPAMKSSLRSCTNIELDMKWFFHHEASMPSAYSSMPLNGSRVTGQCANQFLQWKVTNSVLWGKMIW